MVEILSEGNKAFLERFSNIQKSQSRKEQSGGHLVIFIWIPHSQIAFDCIIFMMYEPNLIFIPWMRTKGTLLNSVVDFPQWKHSHWFRVLSWSSILIWVFPVCITVDMVFNAGSLKLLVTASLRKRNTNLVAVMLPCWVPPFPETG